ncbi:BlaI/MecI/CopY family transcriptional regulator [Sediminibacterium ginsengisoli]|uniref:Predicted transcriptional regulator n=1 Tax=Sediminibacterium ginsengisoli TaxID=413434 RepID=A0A1T4KQH6_9BACT|nr:BlaI/MecI/CopY family transcriptional regulator [Sediminibacterium ginsengisoli]SJZ44665.1 Predicted transcriptional regulator [Sediminibacterium ginsengisoli]
MKPLTKAEEQIMQSIWRLETAFLKDIVEAQPEPRPHSNTVATIVKILVDKGFVGVKPIGRVHQYYPLVSKSEYSSNSMRTLVEGYFEGSFSDAVSFMVKSKELSIKDLELLLQQMKHKKH